jgi:hypothetical protein
MNKGIGMALLAAGVALIIYGFDAPDAVSSEVSRAFAGVPTEKTICLLLGGSAAAVVGVTLAVHSSGKP